MSTELTVATIILTGNGLTPSLVAVDQDGNWFKNVGNCLIYVKGGTLGGKTLTINSQAKCNYASDHDILITEGAAAIHLVGPLPKSRFDDENNRVQITYGAAAFSDGMTIQIIRLP